MGFIQDFMAYNEGNECPREYILWAGYATLSLAMGRRAFLDLEHFTVNSNLYVVLVGPAGNRKTFARDRAMDLLVECIPDVIVSAECETKQGITRFLGASEQLRTYVNHKGETVEFRPYGLFASELMNYLALDPAGMVTFLTDIYDRKFYRYRLKNEEHTLTNPYIVILACTTPDWLTKQIKSEEFCSGFGRRVIFVCDESDKRVRPFMDEKALLAQNRCREFLRDLRGWPGFEFKLTPEANHWFWGDMKPDGTGNGWYFTYKLSDDRFLRAWGRSKHILMFKIAMLTSVSERAHPVITLDHMQLALGLLDNVEKTLPMITSRMGRSELTEPALNVLGLLRNNGGAMLEKVLKMKTMKDFKSPTEQWQVFEWLKQTDQVVAVTKDGKVWLALPERVQKKPTIVEPPSNDTNTTP